MRLICILEDTSSESSGSDDSDTSTVYQPGPNFLQPAPQLDSWFQQQPFLRYPPVIPPVIPETASFQGPFIQPRTFPLPQPFTQPITVTVPPQIPAFHDLVPFRPVPDRQTSENGSVFIPPDLSPASRHSTGEPRPTYPMPPSQIYRWLYIPFCWLGASDGLL